MRDVTKHVDGEFEADAGPFSLEEAETVRDAGVAEARAEIPPRPSVARSAGIVSLAVMGSRILGLVREQV
ncbi:hypothetical protein ABNJ30_20215, partial [Acinetobacter baumannii]